MSLRLSPQVDKLCPDNDNDAKAHTIAEPFIMMILILR